MAFDLFSALYLLRGWMGKALKQPAKAVTIDGDGDSCCHH